MIDYTPLPLKYRPRTWEDVVGQEHSIAVLRRSLQNGRVFSSYIFDGVAGCGKTSAARIFAMSLNCESLGEGASPCLHCLSCTQALIFKNSDIMEIDGPSNNSVTDIRDLRQKLAFSPSFKKRVVIIDEVHSLSRDAFQALLKILEEPPSHVAFILATTNPEAIPATIHSRSIRISFRRHTETNVVSRLQHIAELEGITLQEGSDVLIARFTDGQLRDSVTVLEQLATTYPEQPLEPRLVATALGVVSGTELHSIMSALYAMDASTMESALQTTLERTSEFGMIVRAITDWYRDVLRVKSGAAQVVKRSESDLKLLEDFARTMSFNQVDQALRLTWSMADRVRPSSSMPKTFFLTGLYQLMLLREASGVASASVPMAPDGPPAPLDTTKMPQPPVQEPVVAFTADATQSLEQELARLTES